MIRVYKERGVLSGLRQRVSESSMGEGSGSRSEMRREVGGGFPCM